MKNKEGFFQTISTDLKRGNLRPVYVSDELAVFAVADSFYIASDYTANQDGYVAFLVNSKMVRAMLVDSEFLTRLLTTSDQATLSQMMFRLTDRTFRTMEKRKNRKFYDGLTHKLVDPELEQWIADTYGAPPVYTKEERPAGVFKRLFHNDNRLEK